MLILLPMGGMGQLKVLAMTSVAFWPVVTMVVQRGGVVESQSVLCAEVFYGLLVEAFFFDDA